MLLAEHINNNRWSEKTIADHSLMFFFSANEVMCSCVNNPVMCSCSTFLDLAY